MVPRWDNSLFIECVFVISKEAIKRLVCNLVLPNGGSRFPTVEGIEINLCCKKKNKRAMMALYRSTG